MEKLASKKGRAEFPMKNGAGTGGGGQSGVNGKGFGVSHVEISRSQGLFRRTSNKYSERIGVVTTEWESWEMERTSD